MVVGHPKTKHLVATITAHAILDSTSTIITNMTMFLRSSGYGFYNSLGYQSTWVVNQYCPVISYDRSSADGSTYIKTGLGEALSQYVSDQKSTAHL